MSDYDDLLEGVLTEGEITRPDPAQGTATDSVNRKPAPKASRSSPSVSTRKKQAKGDPDTNEDAPVPARRGMSRQLERSGRCPMYAPRGTVCKTCGKVHPV